jgi:cytochrome c553
MKAIVSIIISLLIASAMSVRAADAKANWAANCAQCHGADGSANTPMGKKIQRHESAELSRSERI